MNNLSIEKVLINKIIPLLMEYFSGKVETVKKMFIDTGFNVQYNTDAYNWEVIKQ
jgi:5-methylcytosine-specific restriction enzyme B